MGKKETRKGYVLPQCLAVPFRDAVHPMSIVLHFPRAKSSNYSVLLQGTTGTAVRAPEGSELQAENRKGTKDVPAPAVV